MSYIVRAGAEGYSQSAHADVPLPGEKRKPQRWFKRYGMRVYDPDGWRNEGKDPEEPVTYEEFERLAMRSTLVPLER